MNIEMGHSINPEMKFWQRFNMGVLVISIFIIVYLTAGSLRARYVIGWGNNDSIYICSINSLILVSGTSFGLRFHVYLLPAILYIVSSVPLQFIFKFTNNGYNIGNNAAWIMTCLFLHNYEKILYAYFLLGNEVTKNIWVLDEESK